MIVNLIKIMNTVASFMREKYIILEIKSFPFHPPPSPTHRCHCLPNYPLSSHTTLWLPSQPGLACEMVRNWRFSSNCTPFYPFVQHFFAQSLLQHIVPLSVKCFQAELQGLLWQISFCEAFFILYPSGRRPQKWVYLLLLMVVVSKIHRANLKKNIPH